MSCYRRSSRRSSRSRLPFVALLVLVLVGSSCRSIRHSPALPRDSFLFVMHKVLFRTCVGDECETVGDARVYGSGFVVHSKNGVSYGFTAAHVCAKPRFKTPGDHVQEDGTVVVHSVKNSIKVALYGGGVHQAEVIELHEDVDICVLRIPGITLPSVRFAKSKPSPGDKVWSLSAPLATFEPHMIPQTDGYASGDVRELRSPLPGGESVVFQAFTIPAASGVSGAPIFNESAEVIGMSIIALTQFENFALSPPFESLKAVYDSVVAKAKHGD